MTERSQAGSCSICKTTH